MITFIFKGLNKSELAQDIIREKIEEAVTRFPLLKEHSIRVTISMDNSPLQAGPDAFGLKLQVVGRKFGGLILFKTAPTLYKAAADLQEALLERLNRWGDKVRVKSRTASIERKKMDAMA